MGVQEISIFSFIYMIFAGEGRYDFFSKHDIQRNIEFRYDGKQ